MPLLATEGLEPVVARHCLRFLVVKMIRQAVLLGIRYVGKNFSKQWHSMSQHMCDMCL